MRAADMQLVVCLCNCITGDYRIAEQQVEVLWDDNVVHAFDAI